MHPAITTLSGLVLFYVGLKLFSGGMKSMGNIEHLEAFIGNPLWMFLGGVVMTLLWQSSSLSTTAIVALVASGLKLEMAIPALLGANLGTTGTIWIASFFVSGSGHSIGMPEGLVKQIAIVHTGANLMMALALLPFSGVIARWLQRFG